MDSRRVVLASGNAGKLREFSELLATSGITLMCQCAEDQPHCHRFLLQDLIRRV